ncbi:hypothetical protein [Methylocaldum sp.]|nr:hypothetical protein [Methylocaldum sp.]HYE33819.1 hypothetical protein [Methylocaldum sp.]
MAYTVSHFLLDRLSVWSIRRIYGDPDAWGMLKASVKETASTVLPETEKV